MKNLDRRGFIATVGTALAAMVAPIWATTPVVPFGTLAHFTEKGGIITKIFNGREWLSFGSEEGGRVFDEMEQTLASKSGGYDGVWRPWKPYGAEPQELA